MKNRTWTILIIGVISLFLLWFLCPVVVKLISAAEGHLPSLEPNSGSPSATTTASPFNSAEQTPEPQSLFNYYNVQENKPDFNLSMHVLEVDPSLSDILVKPVTSHGTLFGYDYLSGMNEKWKAEASINGGFSHPDGLLGGLYIIGNEIMTPATGQYPVLFMDQGKASIKDVKVKIWVDADGKKVESLYFNQFPKGNGLYVFTPSYGTQNRIHTSYLNAVISNGKVIELKNESDSYDIPKDGFLISAVGEYSVKRLKEAVKVGMTLSIGYSVQSGSEKLSGLDWAYECGSWILKNGKVVVPKSDSWVGTLETRTPRTAVGIKEDGKLVFVVVDGRQKGLSDGLSGAELAQRLLSLGIKDAALLDGGASSEIIVNSKIVNSLAAGRERMLACGFVILKK